MDIGQKIDEWLARFLRHKSDTPKTIDQKIYLVRNMIIPAILISFCLALMLFLKLYKLLLLIAPLLAFMIVTVVLLKIIKRGVKWFLIFYYGGYIVMCCVIVLIEGGLPNSGGVWGGAVICFLLVLGLRNSGFLLTNAVIYFSCLLVIGFSFPFLTLFEELTPPINNVFYTFNEIWMCLFLVKAFYDSIVIKTNEAKSLAKHLQELDLLKSKLYANIAHEFRTPLTLIHGNAEEIAEQHDEETTEKVVRIIQSSDKILFLVNQMLNLSKIEEGGLPMHYVQTDLLTFVRFIAGSFQGYADSRKISLHFDSMLPQLMMDVEAEKLEESLSNLLSNAIKYTPEGGDVFVTIRAPEMAKTADREVEISVRDNGIGIPEDQLEKIFIRFYRFEDGRYPSHEGNGIGLTLVKEYLKMMNGSIHVKSRLGEGSEFVLTLPITQNAPVQDVIPGKFKAGEKADTEILCLPSVGTHDENPILLLVEDNKDMVGYLIGLLKEDYRIITAGNGIQGIRQAIEHVPDIILSDVMMPGKDGFQVCAELKNDFRTSHIPIVLLTARADTESRIKGLECGADAYLTKPFNKKELKVCLHNLFVQRETLRVKFRKTAFDKATGEDRPELNEKFLSRAVRFLEKNYKNERYGIDNLYSDLGISRVQLHRKLTALTGQSASGFIRNFRLQKARQLLLETNQNISDIAYEVGFGDANYFSKVFNTEYGITATELRKSFK